ncbi:hypothetical protein Hanom_Chr17g01530121 [Helianthus anomalus]
MVSNTIKLGFFSCPTRDGSYCHAQQSYPKIFLRSIVCLRKNPMFFTSLVKLPPAKFRLIEL